MPFKAGLELTELQNMTVPEDDNISNDSNDFTEVENGQTNRKFILDRESRSLTNSKMEKQESDEDVPGVTSLGMSVFNLSNAIMGSGILGLAFALANTGIILFLFLLVAVMVLSIYSIHLMLVCSRETGTMVYEKIGEQLFGAPGRVVVFASTALLYIGAILSYLFIVKNELPSALKFLMGKEESFTAWYVDGRLLVVIVTCGIILPLCLLKTLGYLGYTSGFSLTCMVFFLIAVIYKKFQIPCGGLELNETSTVLSNTTAHLCKAKYIVFNSKTVYALPTIAFAFVCHPSVLPVYSELKDRSEKRMKLVANISFFSMFVMYLLTAIFGYLTFYGEVQSDLLYMYQSKNDVLILMVRLAVIIAVVLTVPVLFFSVRASFFEVIRKPQFNLRLHILVTTFTLFFLNILVIFIPTMKDIFGVVGVTFANMLIFILPSGFYLKMTQQDRSKFTQRIWAGLFLALGVIFSLVSIPLVIYDWVKSGGS
ncbi:S38A1 protein, partial [Columbina picui]|nr:S38A1 protein [Columbina picui]